MSYGELSQSLCVFIGGAALGVFFFGGLRMTVAAVARARRPGLLFFASVVLRMAVALPGFYLLGGGAWHRYMLALAGFLLSRIVVTLLWPAPSRHAPARESHHGIS